MLGVWEAATHGRPLEPTQPWLSAWVAAALGQSSRVAEVPLTQTVQTKTPELHPSWQAGKGLQKPTESHHTRIPCKKKIIWVCNYTASKKRGEGHGRALRKAACPALSSHLSKNPRRTASGYNKTSLLGCLSPPPSALAPPFLHTHTHARAHTHNHTRNLKEDPISTINT